MKTNTKSVRSNWNDVWIGVAEQMATRSTCSRLKVGSVIVSKDNRKVLGIGFNGNYKGGPNTNDSVTPGSTKNVHAEMNAILNTQDDGTYNHILYVTHLPCEECAKHIINHGKITTVIYKNSYRWHKSIEYFKSSGINIYKHGSCARKYNFNEHYFDSINNEVSAYILGLFYADGTNDCAKGTIALSLQKKDKSILKRIKSELESTRPLQHIRNYSGNPIHQEQYRLVINSRHISNRLKELGAGSNKTFKLEFPDWLPPHLVRHFVRGYFDGDGSLCFSYVKKKNTTQHHFNITSNPTFIKQLVRVIEKHTNIKCYTGRSAYLSLCGNRKILELCNWLYSESTIHIERKFKKYQKLQNKVGKQYKTQGIWFDSKRKYYTR